MRLSWVAACAFAAWTSACWATGLKEQDILAPGYVWLWWLPAFTWTLTAIRTAMGERG